MELLIGGASFAILVLVSILWDFRYKLHQMETDVGLLSAKFLLLGKTCRSCHSLIELTDAGYLMCHCSELDKWSDQPPPTWPVTAELLEQARRSMGLRLTPRF